MTCQPLSPCAQLPSRRIADLMADLRPILPGSRLTSLWGAPISCELPIHAHVGRRGARKTGLARNVRRFSRSRAQRRDFAQTRSLTSETHLSAQPPRAQAPPRLSRPHADQGRHEGSCPSPRQGPQAPQRLIFSGNPLGLPGGEEPLPLATLKKRAEFLRVRGGSRWSCASFVLETKPRQPHSSSADQLGGPRFGFTVTKKLGGAVVRNRIRRRLKAAVAELAPDHARCGFDYVLVARRAALDRPFAALKKELEDALHRVHHPRRARRPPSSGGGA